MLKEKQDNTVHVALWQSFLQGDDKAFALLFDEFADLLFRYGTKFVLDQELVKDCIQDIFVKIYNNRANLSQTDNPKYYLFRALKNKLIDELRYNNRFEYKPLQELSFYVECSYTPGEDDEDEAEIQEKFEEALSLLSPRQKEALYLRFQMGMSYQEIASLLDIKYQSVRNLVHRAIEKVRANMSWSLFLYYFLNYS